MLIDICEEHIALINRRCASTNHRCAFGVVAATDGTCYSTVVSRAVIAAVVTSDKERTHIDQASDVKRP